MKLQILGTGCRKCSDLTTATEQAARELSLDCQIEKVTELRQIMTFGVMTTPALVVDGKVTIAGKVPSVSELKTLLQGAL